MIIEKTIGKEKYVFKFTSLTMRKICEYENIEFHQYDKFTINTCDKWINSLLRVALDVESQGKIILSEYEMDDLIEEMAQKDLQDIINSYFKSVKNLKEKYKIKIDGEVKEKKN